MTVFAYVRAASAEDALEAGRDSECAFLAGGTELLNWVRLGIAKPKRIVDISRIPGLEGVERQGNGIRIGALTRLNDAAQHPLVASDYPVLSQAILKAASAQLRNLATIGGNPLQRTRCPYFRAEEALPCNKRDPGSGCAARHGINDHHAIFGWSDACVAVQPSDPAVALAALDATMVVRSRARERKIPASEFHTLPGNHPERDHVLDHGELIVAIELGAPAPSSAYLKVRERESYEYAIVSAAAVLDLEGTAIQRARLALGSVAHKPWRLSKAEGALAGLDVRDADRLHAAIAPSFEEAKPLKHNAHKVTIAKNAAVRVLQMAAGVA